MQYGESAVVRDVACPDPVWHHVTLEIKKPRWVAYSSVRTDWTDAVSFDRSVGTTEGRLKTYGYRLFEIWEQVSVAERDVTERCLQKEKPEWISLIKSSYWPKSRI